MKLLSTLLPAAMALVLTGPHGSLPVGHHKGALSSGARSTGTLVNVTTGRTKMVLTLQRSGHLETVNVDRSAALTSSDHRALQVQSMRVGDLLTVRSSTLVQDLSQHAATVQGVVSLSSGDATGPLALQVPHSGDILVDTTAHTVYSDPSHQTSQTNQIQEADELKVVGTYDVTLGEMTETSSITRLGPAPQKRVSG